MTEPEDAGPRERSGRRRAVLLGAAVAAAALLALLAPADWPAGPAGVVVTSGGDTVLRGETMVGSTTAAELRAVTGGREVAVEFPGGVPRRGQIAARIRVTEDGTVLRPAVDALELRLILPDERSELIPVTRWNQAEGSLEAARRPTADVAVVLGLLGFVVVLWVTEALPLFVTSLLIPVVLVVSGVAGAESATAPFFNPIIVLFFAGFLMAEAMRRAELDHFVAVMITAGAGRSAVSLFATLLGVTAFLSMWMSNTAATAVLVPIAIAITDPLGEARYQRILVLGIAYAATIGGVGSAIGTPANQLAIEFLDEFGDRSISFAGWFAYGLPMVMLFLPVIGLYLWGRSRVTVAPGAFRTARRVAIEERRRLGTPSRDQMVVLAIFVLVAAGWLTQTFHGVHAGIVALAGAVLLFFLGRINAADLGNISWPSLLTFGGGLTLGLFLSESGASDFVATRLTGLAGLPGPVAILAVAFVTLVLTTVASNTASAAILIPLAIPLAAVVGLDPVVLVVVVAIASSIDFALVIGTPPTMIAYSTRLYTAGQIFRTGIVLDLAGVLVLVLAVTRVWELLGLT